MTQEETQLNIRQTTIPYNYDVLLERLNKQMDIVIGIQYGYSTNSHKHNYNKYLFAILKNIQTITESFNRHNEITDQEYKLIDDKIQEIRKVLKNEYGLLYVEDITFNELMGVLLNDLLDLIFNLNLWKDDDDVEETLDNNDDDSDSEDDEFLEVNSQIPDHASIINVENDNKKRKCNLI